MKTQIIRVGVKNFPPAHGGVERMAYSTINGLANDFDFTVFTEWHNDLPPPQGINVIEFKPGIFAKIRQIRAEVRDKKRTILHFQRETFMPFAVLFACMGYTVVASIHGCAWRLKKWGWIYRIAFYVFDVLACNLARRTFFVGDVDRRAFRHWTVKKLYHIPNGVPLCECLDRPREKDMVFVGRMAVEKNLVRVIDEAENAGRYLDLYGPFDVRHPEYRELILKRLETCNFVKWFGAARPEELYSVLCNYSCFVNISFAEGMPTAVLEAAACGLRLYLSDIPQHRMLGFGDAAYFHPEHFSFPPRPKDGRRYSVANAGKVALNYSIDGVIDQYRSLYRSLEKHDETAASKRGSNT